MSYSRESDTSQNTSTTFGRFHPAVQKWIYTKRWTELRDLQERAGRAILDGGRDVILAAATASGKTEAAFLPIVSRLAEDSEAGVGVLYISPLKALINDQYRRLKELCDLAKIPVHPWHGDVAASKKKDVLKGNGGLLLITPESLEALFVNRGMELPGLFGSLKYIVIDELHAFIGTERGKQLQSLMNRVDLVARAANPRIALSATLGDMALAAEYLRPGKAGMVEIIESDEGEAELLLQVRGYLWRSPDDDAEDEIDANQIANHIFTHLRGEHNLIFANSRRNVEQYADLLRRKSETDNVPNEFYPHHGNLSKELRENLERALKQDKPISAICTSTLELGIDIGSVHSVAQIGCPPSVAGLRQRLGRSGRRAGQPAILRVYHSEDAIDTRTSAPDLLRIRLFQSVAMIQLALRGWFEPPITHALHLSTLVQQFLSIVVQHGGVKAREAYSALCKHGPFRDVTPDMFVQILRTLARGEYLMQASDGTLLLGPRGERITGHYSFYAAFSVDIEYRISCQGKTLGTIPIDYAIAPGMYIIFAGKRWKIVDVTNEDRKIEVIPGQAGKVPRFGGDPGFLHDEILKEMYSLYQDDSVPRYLNKGAVRLLEEGRKYFKEFQLDKTCMALSGNTTYLFPWIGTAALNAISLALLQHEIPTDLKTSYLIAEAGSDKVTEVLKSLASQPAPSGPHLASAARNKQSEKYHHMLSEELLREDYASLKLDVARAWYWLENWQYSIA